MNGDQCDDANRRLRQVVAGLTPEALAQMAERHGIAPAFPEPWKNSGSADRTTTVRFTSPGPGPASKARGPLPNSSPASARAGRESTCPANPEMMAHNIYGIAYQYYKGKTGLESYVNRDVFLKFADRMLHHRPEETGRLVARLDSDPVSRRRVPL
jgi:hypothetical protein